MQRSSFFRLHALLRLRRPLLHPFIALSFPPTKSTSHFNCIATFLHPSTYLSAWILPSSLSLSLSLTLFSCFLSYLSLSLLYVPLISLFLCLNPSLYLFLHFCLNKIISSSVAPNNIHFHPPVSACVAPHVRVHIWPHTMKLHSRDMCREACPHIWDNNEIWVKDDVFINMLF